MNESPLIYPTAGDAAVAVANLVVNHLNTMTNPVIGWATGGTPEPVYAELVRRHAAGDWAVGSAGCFNLDEYVGLAPDHPQSYAAYMRRHLFDAVGWPGQQRVLPAGNADDPAAEAARYDAAVVGAGITWQLLGIGVNGHIAFNEPGSSADSATRVVDLTTATISANARFFQTPAEVPRRAITMGIGTIMQAERIVLLATGRDKADAVAAALTGPVGAACPASWLRRHRAVTWVLDRDAAAGLSAK